MTSNTVVTTGFIAPTASYSVEDEVMGLAPASGSGFMGMAGLMDALPTIDEDPRDDLDDWVEAELKDLEAFKAATAPPPPPPQIPRVEPKAKAKVKPKEPVKKLKFKSYKTQLAGRKRALLQTEKRIEKVKEEMEDLIDRMSRLDHRNPGMEKALWEDLQEQLERKRVKLKMESRFRDHNIATVMDMQRVIAKSEGK